MRKFEHLPIRFAISQERSYERTEFLAILKQQLDRKTLVHTVFGGTGMLEK